MKIIVKDYSTLFKIEMFNSLLDFIKNVEKESKIKTIKELKNYLKEEIKKLK